MSMILCLPIVIAFILGFNLGLPRLFKNWKAKPWVKALIIYFITLIFTPMLGNILLSVINASLQGTSGGIGMIGVGIGAGIFLILNVMLFLIVNFGWMIVRLLKG